MFVKTTERLAKTRANEGSDDTNLPYKISARDFRLARLPHLCFLFRSGPVVSGLYLYNLPPPLRPSPFFFLSSCALLPPQQIIPFTFVLFLSAPSLDARLWKGKLLPPFLTPPL